MNHYQFGKIANLMRIHHKFKLWLTALGYNWQENDILGNDMPYLEFVITWQLLNDIHEQAMYADSLSGANEERQIICSLSAASCQPCRTKRCDYRMHKMATWEQPQTNGK